MNSTFRQSMTWLHTWIGLILGWVCYAIFVTGTASYYRPEITRWMRPELPASPGPIEAAHTAVRALEERAADASRWFVDVPDERSSELRLFWQPGGGGRFRNEVIDPVSGAPVQARESHGGEFFYRFHFQLLMPHPWGRYTAGVAAMVMFVALITGVIAHRRFFADMFLFRPGRALARSWLDFHNTAGVLSLPFFLMITFSGLVIFNALYLPWAERALGGGRPAARAAGASGTTPAAPVDWIAPAPLGPMLDEASRRWVDGPFVRRISATGRGTAKAEVELTRGEDRGVSIRDRDRLVFDGVTGALRTSGRLGDGDGPGRATHGVLYGLHLGRFATPMVRALLAALGVIGTGLIASGLILWTVKRRTRLVGAARGARAGVWLVERLNIAAIAGMPVAIAALFWANRLIPIAHEGRAEREVLVFLIAWGVALLHACVRPVAAGWREQLLGGAALFVALPVLDAIVARPHLVAAGRSGDWVYLGFEFTAVGVGVFLAAASGKFARWTAPPSGDAMPEAAALAHRRALP